MVVVMMVVVVVMAMMMIMVIVRGGFLTQPTSHIRRLASGVVESG